MLLLAGCVGVLHEEAPEDPDDDDGRVASVEACRGLWDPAVKDAKDHSVETVDVIIRSDGPFRVGVPVPVADPETSFASWVDNASAVSEKEVSFKAAPTTKGAVILIEGDTHAVLCSQSIQYPYLGNRCCAEAYLDAAWTTDPSDARPDRIPVLVEEGNPSVEIRYEALSDLCGREADFSAASLRSGWNHVTGSDAAWCA